MTTIVPEQRTAVGRYSRALEVILATAPTGAAAVVACTVPAATSGPPLHVHAASDETFFVLSGVLLVRADDQVATIPEGGLVHVSYGMPHTFATTPGSPARFLVLHTPGGSGSPTSLRGTPCSSTAARCRATATSAWPGFRRLPPREVTMSKIGAPKRVIEIEPIEEPAAEPAKVPEPATVPERV